MFEVGIDLERARFTADLAGGDRYFEQRGVAVGFDRGARLGLAEIGDRAGEGEARERPRPRLR